jgi:hypothetical protein
VPIPANWTTGAVVRPDDPLPDDYGVVVRGTGTWQIVEPYLQRRFDLTSTPGIFYVGYAARGTATASPAWTIKQIAFDAQANPTSLQWSVKTAVWDNRAVTVYS